MMAITTKTTENIRTTLTFYWTMHRGAEN